MSIGNYSIVLSKRKNGKDFVALFKRDESGKFRFVKSTTKNVQETYRQWYKNALKERDERWERLERNLSLSTPFRTILDDTQSGYKTIAQIVPESGKYSLHVFREYHKFINGIKRFHKEFIKKYTFGSLNRAIALLKAEITVHGANQPRNLTI